jgi:Sulfotransferase family
MSTEAASSGESGSRGHTSRVRKFLNQLSGRSNDPLAPQLGEAPQALLARARASFATAENSATPELIAKKTAAARAFDIDGMSRVVSICRWGSSGSLLVASNLDGHDDVVLLPGNLGSAVYSFFASHAQLSLEEKLLTYPFASIDGFEHFHFYFKGDHPIRQADYQASVTALAAVYGDRPGEVRESRRTFFRCLHVAYALAAGHAPSNGRPLMVYAQALANDLVATLLVEDFPQARFIHTVRDPVTNVGRIFEHDLKPHGFLAPLYVVARLTFGDKAHAGMEERTRAIRFEDLHLRQEEAMRAVASWVGVSFQPSLLESTWNGSSYTWKPRTGAKGWSGARPEQAKRNSKNVSFLDRGLLYANFNEDFVQWGYLCPAVFRFAPVRVVTLLLLVLLPTQMEWVTARLALKAGGFARIVKALAQLCVGRAAIVTLYVADLFRRLSGRKRVLTLLPLTALEPEKASLEVPHAAR